MYLYLSTASCLHLYYIYFSTIIKVYIYIYSIQWCIHKTQSVPTFHINPDSCTEACLSILFGLGSWEVDDWRFPASKGGRSLLVFRVPMKMCWHLGEKKKQIPSKILHNLEILCTFVSRIVRQKDLAFSSSAYKNITTHLVCIQVANGFWMCPGAERSRFQFQASFYANPKKNQMQTG